MIPTITPAPITVLLDTNIAMDIITKREGYEDSLMVLKYCELGQVKGILSALTVADLMYILRKHIPPSQVSETVQTLLLVADMADILKSDMMYAFSSGMKDFEDAVQAACSKRIKADYIITKNIKDFKGSDVPALLPKDFLKMLRGGAGD